ncbi:hypothetical protein [Chryseobacterium piperi]|nr:hypothetical protein [Chryseobacterium piperi]
MKKNLLFAMAMLPFAFYAQVGINTTSPKATLDIKGVNYDRTGTSQDNGKATLRIDGNTEHALDIGTISSAPYGAYIQSLDKNSNRGLPVAINSNGGNVGIGMIPTKAPNSSSPSKLYVNTVATAPNDGVATLVRNETTGEIMAVRVGSNTKSFSTATYQLNNVNGDWVNNFDTKISATDYTVIVTGLSFGGSPNAKGLRVGAEGTPAGSTYNPLNYSAFIQNGTWRLTADYDGGNPPPGVNGNWTINVLIINNSLINGLSTQTYNLNGSSTGSAASAPAGL